MTDPIVERLDDALERVRDLERRSLNGEMIAPASLVVEVRAIRDDLLAERRDRMNRDQIIHARIDGALPRQPWAKIGTAFLVIFTTVVGGLIVALIGKGLSQ
jgi:hypothetical protein